MQFVARRSSEFGVQSQYLDGELHLVDDPLAGRLHFYPKFQVFWRIVEAVAVLMVDIFTLKKFSAKGFFHYKPMLVRLPTAAKVDSAIARRVNVTSFVNWSPFPAFIATLLTAKSLLFVVAGVLSVLGAAQLSLSNSTAELTLKRGWGLLVHVEQLQPFILVVKENV